MTSGKQSAPKYLNFSATVVAGLLILLSIRSVVFADSQSSKLDFDQGADPAQVLETVRSREDPKEISELLGKGQSLSLLPTLTSIDLPPELEEILKKIVAENPDSQQGGAGICSKVVRIPADPCVLVPPSPHCQLPSPSSNKKFSKGSVLGPFVDIILNSAVYADAAQFPPLLRMILPPPQQLLNDWDKIDAKRLELLSDAQGLDVEDQELYDDGVALLQVKETIKNRGKILDEQMAAYNEGCLGDSPTYPDDYCDAWREQYNTCVANIHNPEVECSNAKLAAWRRKYAELQPKGDVFRALAKKWEDEQIKPFIQESGKALDEAGITTVRVQAQGDDMPGGGKSVVASFVGPMCVEMGEQLLMDLKDKLTSRELAQRDVALMKAANWMRNVAAPAGGIHGPWAYSGGFHNPDPEPKNARIDVEVKRGHAFLYCPATKK